MVSASGSVRARVWSTLHALLPAILAFGGLVVALLTQFLLTDLKGTVDRPAWGFLVAVALFAASALVVWSRGKVGEPGEERPAFELPRSWEIGLVIAVIALAAFFRFWQFLSFPPGLWYDEAVNGTDAYSIMDGDRLTVWRSSNFGHSTIFFYLLIVSFKLFGYTLFAMRFVPAMAGMAAVVGFYFLARWLLGAVPAIVATALLAVSRWAVTFSRISWEASLQPVLEIMAVYFLVRGLEKRTNYLYFFMAGGSLAAGIYTYLAFRFVPFVLLFFLLYIAAAQWRLLWSNRAGLVVYAVSFLVVIAPLGQFALRNQDLFLARTRDINVFNEIDDKDSYQPLRDNIRASIEMMNVKGDLNGRHNLPGAPMVDEVSGALLVLGFAAASWSLLNWRKATVAGWFVLALVPGVFTISIENPSAIRGIGAIPPLYLLVGLAVATLYAPLRRSARGRWVFGATALAIVGGAAAINYYDLYERQANDRRVYEAFTPEYTQVGQIIADRAGKERVIVSRQFSGHQAVTVLTRGKKFDPYVVPQQLVLPATDSDVLLILDAEQFGMLPTLRTLYPNLRQDDYVDPYDRVFFTRITIPRSDIAQLHQLSMRRNGQAETGTLDREWTEADVAPGPIEVSWEGYLWSGQPRSGTFRLQVPGEGATLTLDGAPVPLDADGRSGPVDLTLGEHRFSVSARITTPGKVKLEFADAGASGPAIADALYNVSTGDRGFLVLYRSGNDFSNAVTDQGRVPFPVPVPVLAQKNAIEYVGVINLSQSGEYGFALTGKSSAQLFIDGELVVDNGGGHGRTRVESSASLRAGQHTISIQYTTTEEANWVAAMKVPEGDWKDIETSDVSYPEGPYRPPATVTLEPDPAWPRKTLSDLEKPSSIVRLSQSEMAVAGKGRVVILNEQSEVVRRFDVEGASQIVDMDRAPDGRLVVLDGPARAIIMLDPASGAAERVPVTGNLPTAAGLDVSGDSIYVVSPSGGGVYAVPLAGGAMRQLEISLPETPIRARQPSDIAIDDSGVIYITDFEGKTIIRSPDGVEGRAFRGVGGTGEQLPHIDIEGDLVFVTDPTRARLLVYDRTGKQRGVYTFSGRPAPNPVGLDATPDGRVYIADISGAILRMTVTVPPETQAELDVLP
jgi:4-amino-4-deoxy-L-arabinose transferase-like glycosyltransferase/streptogramin lyase